MSFELSIVPVAPMGYSIPAYRTDLSTSTASSTAGSTATQAQVQAQYSCDKPTHNHIWPTAGVLQIERCEHYCLFCRGAKAQKKWSSAWFLRRHVRETHVKNDYPDLYISEGWFKCPGGNARPLDKKQRAPGSNKKRSGTKLQRKKMEKAVKLRNYNLVGDQQVYQNQAVQDAYINFSSNPCIGSTQTSINSLTSSPSAQATHNYLDTTQLYNTPIEIDPVSVNINQGWYGQFDSTSVLGVEMASSTWSGPADDPSVGDTIDPRMLQQGGLEISSIDVGEDIDFSEFVDEEYLVNDPVFAADPQDDEQGLPEMVFGHTEDFMAEFSLPVW